MVKDLSQMTFREVDAAYNIWAQQEEWLKQQAKRYMAHTTSEFSWVLPKDQKKLKQTAISIKYGIPNQVLGNPETANLFICLMNPRTRVVHRNTENLTEYIVAEGENYPKVQDYIAHITSEQNVLVGELARLTADFPDARPNRVERLNYYYFAKYYYPLFVSGGNVVVALDKVRETSAATPALFFQKLANLPICNLELFPYRSYTSDEIKFKAGFGYPDLTSTTYVVALIVKRIMNYQAGESQHPLFIFRNYEDWFAAITQFLQQQQVTIQSLTQYFYKFASSQAVLSQANLVNVSSGEQVSDEDYQELLQRFDVQTFTKKDGFGV